MKLSIPDRTARLEMFKATMRLFGYSWFCVIRIPGSGWEVVVRERIPDANNWPALWQVCEKLLGDRGCGGPLFRQIGEGTLPEGEYYLGEPETIDRSEVDGDLDSISDSNALPDYSTCAGAIASTGEGC